MRVFDQADMTELSLPLAVSIGEPAGIGANLLLQLFDKRQTNHLTPFIAYGNVKFLQARAQRLGLVVKFEACEPEDAVNVFSSALPVFDIGQNVVDTPGKASEAGAEMVVESIKRATTDCLNGKCAALVTAPINKSAVKRIGFKFPGHTEFLAHLCAKNGNNPTPIMMLAHGDFRVVPLTIHVALSKVPGMINKAMIVAHTKIIAKDLQNRFGISSPKIAITGLNPHAGENGAFGHEDADEIAPAVSALREAGIDADGPFPADTAFHLPNWEKFDVVVAMYHDQALIPIKTIAFEEAVNITLGLPIVRTSPDHGTAYDLAGSGTASTSSMLAAIRLAQRLGAGVL